MSNKLNLKFTARDVAAVEEALDGSLEKIIASFKLTTLIQFLMVGLRDKSGNRLNLDEEKTFDIVDEKIKEYGKIELQIEVIDALIEAGFLPRAIDTNQMRTTLSEAIAEASKIPEASKKAGENTK
ncbi:hypothetical protein [Candidatus Nanosyncoccus alces]|uniref:Uncharacterized protein n=1 Tax=Candidatus Nanosyncoccus alces TaxID=2171997 RepID=A0ABY0FMT7_9BACT|nr:hypothetical protein [Candidatus Nanosyncoccus alces]RYC75238.1 hypothetical protein G3RUM_00185 [Candidatus Nanosyncoccus alces]